jgi:hypothetical protein
LKKSLLYIGVILIVVFAAYLNLSKKDDSQVAQAPSQSIPLVGGGEMELALEEAQLPINEGQKKIVITGLGLT